MEYAAHTVGFVEPHLVIISTNVKLSIHRIMIRHIISHVFRLGVDHLTVYQ